MNDSTPPDQVDKERLYAEFQRGQRWRDNLARKLAHKSLDIGDSDDMHVDNSRNTYGFGWKELAIAVLGLGLAGSLLLDRWQLPATAPSTPSAQPEVEPIRGKIRFWVDDPAVQIDAGEQRG